MIICINCEARTKASMDGLLKKNLYRDYSELIAVAVDNLRMLELEVAKKGALIICEGLARPATSAVALPNERTKPRNLGKVTPTLVPPNPVRIPDLFRADGLDGSTATMPEITVAGKPGETFTLDRWLFGQYNKLLPVKANCRALLRITVGHPAGVLLEDAAPQIGGAAALLGDYLADHDRRHQITRDDSLAVAFPRSGPDSEKSRTRYANQFVGSVNSQGILSGLLCDYRMAALTPGAVTRLMPTEPAIQFAMLANPVLDCSQVDPAQKFSPEESSFLLKHIRAHVPVEAFAFKTLIEAIAEGAITPDKLDETLRVHVPTETNRSLSPSFLTSQRSGALSRMADLGLITRERKGVRVSYIITEQGQRFMESKQSFVQGED